MREGRIVTVETGNSTEITAIKSQIDTLGKQFSALMQHVNNQAVNYVQPVPTMSQPTVTAIPLHIPAAVRPMQWQQSSKPTTNARPKACFNCGDPSHIKPQCPLLQSNVSNSYQTPVNVQSQSQQQGCFICGDPSHFKRSCPQWLKNNPTAATTSNVNQRPDNTQQKRSYGSTGKDDNSNVYINAIIGRYTCYMFVGFRL